MPHRQTFSHKRNDRKPGQWSRPERRRILSVRPWFELLESRRLLTSFVVKNIGDSGVGSLRQAILDVNSSPAGQIDVITFEIGNGTEDIEPLSALPVITHPVTIDGSAPANFPNQVIAISGVADPDTDGLVIAAGSSVVKNLDLNLFTSNGKANDQRNAIILKSAGGDLVEGCYIGTDTTGTIAGGNDVGIGIQSSSNNTIGGTTAAARNIISGNYDGIAIANVESVGNLIEGNYIGTDVSSAQPLGNDVGILVSFLTNELSMKASAANTIGGVTAAAANVVSGNTEDGIQLDTTSKNVIEGNDIGTTAGGMNPLPNDIGVFVFESTANIIGGPTQAAANLISGNQTAGVVMAGTASTANLVEGNSIGLNAKGNQAVPNGYGVLLTTYTDANNVVHGPPSNNTIGGYAPSGRNIISGNNSSGIELDSGSANNLIEGNWIGIIPTETGAVPLGNGQGTKGGAESVFPTPRATRSVVQRFSVPVAILGPAM